MQKTQIATDFVSSLTRKTFGNIILESAEAKMETEYLNYDNGFLILRDLSSNAPYQIIKLLSGCFKQNDCELEEVLKEENVLESSDTLEGIIMVVCGVPVVVSRYDYDADEIYDRWCKFKELKDTWNQRANFDLATSWLG